MTEVIIPTPQEFFNTVSKLETPLEVSQACNELLDNLAEKYAVSTISRKLSAYKKHFYGYIHTNPKLNESVLVNGESKTQHIAGQLLALSDEQSKELKESREINAQSKAGIDGEGNIRDVQKPKIDIEVIIRKACDCLVDMDSKVVACGLMILTGLRANELLHLKRKLADSEVVERDIEKIGEYKIAIKGISKKQHEGIKESKSYLVRYSLAPADLIVKAYQKIKTDKDLLAISIEYEDFRRSSYFRVFGDRFKSIFGTDLSTVEAYSDDGKLVKNDGSSHKARAFYACAIRAILKAKNTRNKAINKYVQLCLNHGSEGETIKYLGKYDESEFINPVDITLTKNIRGLGMVNTLAAKKIEREKSKAKDKSQVTISSPKTSLNVDEFINGITPELQVKFTELMNETQDITLALIDFVNQNCSGKSNVSKIPPVKDTVADIVDAIMKYNSQCVIVTERLKPVYSVINKIGIAANGKSIARTTVTEYLKSVWRDLSERLENMGIVDGTPDVTDWNAKYHRKDMSSIIDKVVTIYK